MECSQSGSSVHGIFQSRVLEWVAMPSSRGSFWHRHWTCISCVSCVCRQILYHRATWEAKRNVHMGREDAAMRSKMQEGMGNRLRNRKAALIKYWLLAGAMMRLIYITKNTELNFWKTAEYSSPSSSEDVTFLNRLLVDSKLRCWRLYGKSTISRLKNQPWAVENLICNFVHPEIKCIYNWWRQYLQ